MAAYYVKERTMRTSKGKTALIALIAIAGFLGGVTGCASDPARASYKAGTYTATAQGKNGDIVVRVTFGEGSIENVVIEKHQETDGLSDAALGRIPSSIVRRQSLSVDAIAGATMTSEAIVAAVKDCVKQAGGDYAALSGEEKREQASKTMEADVVVVGGGASGTAAGLSAVEGGARVVVLEMTPAPAGQGTLAGGLFAIDSAQQKAKGKTVSGKWVYDQFASTANYTMNGGLLGKIIARSGATVDWLIANGCRLTLAHPSSGGYYEHRLTHPAGTLHGYTDGGVAGIKALHASIAAKGGTVVYDAKVTELLLEGGKAVGVTARMSDGSSLTVRAASVVLATGGFGGDAELVKRVFGEGFGASMIGTNIGTGIALAAEAGADADYGKAITMHYGLSRGDTARGSALNTALMNPFLHVDVDGNRFMNEESFVFEAIKSSNAVKSLPRRTAYEIFDGTMLETVRTSGYGAITDVFAGELATDPTVFIEVGRPVDTGKGYKLSHTPTDLSADIAKYIAKGSIVSADSPEELGRKLGMTKLAATIARYNQLCAAGIDSDQYKSAKYLDRLEGTLYAVKITPSVFLGTLGGISINADCEVLRADGKAIPGLYAAGSDTSGVYGNSYVYFEGGTLGYAYGSGRLAGESASRAALGE